MKIKFSADAKVGLSLLTVAFLLALFSNDKKPYSQPHRKEVKNERAPNPIQRPDGESNPRREKNADAADCETAPSQ